MICPARNPDWSFPVEGSEAQKKPPSPLNYVTGAIAGLIGWYAGINMVIPMLAVGLFIFLMKKAVFTRESPLFLTPSSFLFGHFFWMILGVMILYKTGQLDTGAEGFGVNLIEALSYLVFSLYLLFRPGSIAALIVIIWESMVLVLNVIQFLGLEWNTDNHKTIVVHIMIRSVIIGASVIAIRKLRSMDEAGIESDRDSENVVSSLSESVLPSAEEEPVDPLTP